MQTILVINSKGGSGKTTIATNLASVFASRDVKTALMDYDPQGSSLQWHSLRPAERPAVYAINASKSRSGQTRAWQLHTPPDTERLIIDAPAGITGGALQELVRRADVILIPVGPSSLDVHATSEFVGELLVKARARAFKTHIGVIANRVRRGVQFYEPLERFLASLKIPFITSLTDTDNYIWATEGGIGIHEMEPHEASLEQEQWAPLLRWLESPSSERPVTPARPRLNVVNARVR
jgi:chromosome partitioning protein